MAVPFRRTSKTKKRLRRSHDFLTLPTINVCPNCGGSTKPHYICPHCGYYKGKKIK